MFARIRKALVAAVVAGAAAAGGAEIAGSVDTLAEWLVVLSAAIVAGVATWGTPNAPPGVVK